MFFFVMEYGCMDGWMDRCLEGQMDGLADKYRWVFVDSRLSNQMNFTYT